MSKRPLPPPVVETHPYRGRSIRVIAEPRGRPDQWTWSYTIDGGHFGENADEMARSSAEAIHDAKGKAEYLIREEMTQAGDT